jgi:hypothetical protein
MGQPWHPRCGKRFPSGHRAGHCAVCCETFIGLATFDRHLSRDEEGKYLHLDPATADADQKWWADDNGNWHKGDRLTEEQKAEMFAAK